MNEDDVGVIIVTFNSAQHIERCLRSLASTPDRPLSVVLVDNASEDATLELVRHVIDDLALRVDVIANGGNQGFASGVNQAAAHLQSLAPYAPIVLVNPDLVVEPLTLGRLIKRLDDSGNSTIVGGVTRPPSHWAQPSVLSVAMQAFGSNANARHPAQPAWP